MQVWAANSRPDPKEPVTLYTLRQQSFKQSHLSHWHPVKKCSRILNKVLQILHVSHSMLLFAHIKLHYGFSWMWIMHECP